MISWEENEKIVMDKCDKLKECFKEYKKKEKLEDVKCECESKHKSKSKKTKSKGEKTKKIKFVNYPKVFIVQLKRFLYDFEEDETIKITKKVSFPLEFNPKIGRAHV